MRETRLSLQTREEELADCKALIRLLSDQLEQAHKRSTALTEIAPSIQTTTSPPQSDIESVKDSPILENSEFVLSPRRSPGSLYSLQSNFGSDSGDDMETRSIAMKVKEQPTTAVTRVDSLHAIRVPRRLEHVPQTVRRRPRPLLSEVSPPPETTQPTAYQTERRQSQIPTKRNSPNLISPNLQHSRHNSQLITLAVSGIKPEVPAAKLPPEAEDMPIPVKVPAQQRLPLTLRGRIFRSKSDLQELAISDSGVPPEPIVKKKPSFIRFWKKPPAAAKMETTPKPFIRAISKLPSPQSTSGCEPNFTAPHESDRLARYPKVRPSYLSVTRSIAARTTNPEWRHSVGRQVAEMVQHWEEETSKRTPENIGSCANYVASKRHSTPPERSSAKDVDASSLLSGMAARDSRAAKAATVTRAESLRIGERERLERIGKLSSKREELVRKMGLRDVHRV